MTRWTYIALVVLATSTPVAAGDYQPCSEYKQLVGACWDIRGRVSYANGNPSVRIWPVGTHRLLGVRESEPPLLPPDLATRLSWDAYTFADLRVCPLTRERPDIMQVVCISSA